eukprot:5527602-Alexandrium_andersonii.AAC.1
MENFEQTGMRPPPPARAETAMASAEVNQEAETMDGEHGADILLQSNEDSLNENTLLPMRDE